MKIDFSSFMFTNIYIYTALSALITFYLIKRCLPLLGKYLLDKPNERSSHLKAKPRGGGIIFVFIGSLFSLFAGNNIPIICLPLAIVGIIDDLSNLSPLKRYFAQIITVLVLFYFTIFSDLQIFDFPNYYLLIIYLFLIIGGTAIINFTNFMDGIDGLVGGCFTVIFISAALVNDISILPLSGAVFGFLILNWYPSKVFMGDAGSTFLGAVLTGLVYNCSDFLSFISLILISSPLLIDATVCLIRRYLDNQNIFRPHKLHLYQRLSQAGLSHSRVSSIYIMTTLILFISYQFYGLNALFISFLITLLIGIYLDMFVALPFRKSKN